MNFKYKELILTPLITMLVACGGDGGFTTPGSAASGSGDTGDDGSDGGDTGTAVQLALGELSGSTFNSGKLTLGTGAIAAGGQTSAAVSVVNLADSSAYTGSTIVSFTSTCVEQGLSSITSPITTTSGIAQTVYTANGCIGTDTITASISSGAEGVGNITVASAELGALTFNSATPTTLALKNLSGAGLETVAEVTFKLLDKTNSPIKGETITFTLSDAAGGVSLTNTSSITDADGVAIAYVNSGTVKTTFTVTAQSESTPELNATSTNIAIGTGLPIHERFSVGPASSNPYLKAIGQTVKVSAYVSDFYGNRIPEGTKVSFYAKHGIIESECAITSDGCGVDWTFAYPIPDNGIISIMATIKGEETQHSDLNGNNLFDDDNGETFDSLGEPYVDENGNGTFDVGETYVDVDENQTYTTPLSDKYRGVRCTDTAKANGHCASTADIFLNTYIIYARPVQNSGVAVFNSALDNIAGGSLNIANGGQAQVVLYISDPNGNTPAEGTSISVTGTPLDGHSFDIVGGSLTVEGNRYNPISLPATITLTGDGEPGLAGSIKVEITNADGTPAFTTFSINEL